MSVHEIYDVASFAVTLLVLFLVIILIRYLIAEWWVGNLMIDRFVLCRGMKRHQMGIAFTAVLCGIFLREMHYNGPWQQAYLLFAGTGLVGIGSLCLVRVLAPEDWGHHAWLICAGVTALVTAIYAAF